MSSAMICLLITLLGLTALAKGSSGDCPPLPLVSLKNGAITTTRNGFRFSCDRGYFLAGREQILCRSGKWPSQRPPRCVRKGGFCDPPPPIPNAKIWGDDFTVGSIVMYTCLPGYRMLGNDRRKCENNLAWSGLNPVCQAEDEPLQNVAVRLEKQFIQSVGSHSNDSRARSLDLASIQNGLEIVILIDRSSSVDPKDFKIGIDFIKFLLEEFGVRNGDNPVGTRAAVVTFGSEVDIVFNLDSANITDSEAANRKLDTVKAEGGGTALVPAMTTVFIDIAHLLRPEAKKALFVITDGEPTVGGQDITPEDAASELKEVNDFEIFAVGIGNGINVNFLTQIASVPAESHVFMLKKYSQLKDMVSIIRTLPEDRPKPGPEKCGYIDESQNPTEYDRWPWLAAVYVSFPAAEGQPENNPFKMSLCAGALICSRWVLTAASCFYESDRRNILLSLQEVFVVMGEHDLLELDKEQRNYYATDVQTHPKFDPLNLLENNLALIQLNEAVPLNGTFRTICLPRTDLVKALHEDLTTNASTAGWGRPLKDGFNGGINGATTSYILRTRTVALAEEGECLRSLKMGSLKNTFCAGFGQTSCFGSIGSPIVAQNPDTGFRHIMGVLSDKSNCYHGYNQFTELRAYIPWIDEITHNCRSHHEM